MGNLKDLLRLKDIKQKKIALEIGVSQPTVSDWVNGKKIPEGKNLQKLADLLGVEPSVIIGYIPAASSEDEDVMEIRERVRRDPDYRTLFRAAKTAAPEHLRAVTAFLKLLEESN